MQIGAMNHPALNLLKEIESAAQSGFDFIDLTLEPPLAAARGLDVRAVRHALEACNLGVVGHTAYYLPLGSPFESLRRAAVEELTVCLRVFAELGASWMNLHPDRQAPFHSRQFVIERNLQTINDLLGTARDCGIGLMIENLPQGFNSPAQLAELLDSTPELGLHLDIGHANLMVERNTTDSILEAYGPRLRHVHLHDNKGGSADLHLPLGTGALDTAHHVRSLHAHGYDGTVTLEVFAADLHYLAYSRDVFRRLWNEARVRSPTPDRVYSR